MRVEHRDGSQERRVLMGMITSTDVLSRIAPRWEAKPSEGLFPSDLGNTVGAWCVKYFEKYGRAPGKEIEAIYESWEETADKDTAKLVAKFLDSLSGEYDRIKKEVNSKHIIDIASDYFLNVKIRKVAEALQGDADLGELQRAVKRINDFTGVELGHGSGVDLFRDQSAFDSAFSANTAPPLFSYPGALKAFFGRAFRRGGFISFMGKEKIGKSTWLVDLAWRAAWQGNRVLFIAVGDEDEDDIHERFAIRALGRPILATDPGEPVCYPLTIEPHTGAVGGYERREFRKALPKEILWKKVQKELASNPFWQGGPLIKLHCYPSLAIGADSIRDLIRSLDRKKWLPDVVVVDYADNLSAPPGYSETRHGINATWQKLRALSQEFKLLTVTATQADADAYGKGLLTMKNFSEDKRKFSHVTGMCGLNEDDREKEAQAQRLNWLVLRKGKFVASKVVYVANCLAIGNPCVLSTF